MKLLPVAMALVLLGGCDSRFAFKEIDSTLIDRPFPKRAHSSEEIRNQINDFAKTLSEKKPQQLNSKFVTDGMLALLAQDYVGANENFQRALKFEPRNASLHVLNAFSHQLRGEAGDPEQYKLAEVGYRLAARMDPGNSRVSYFMGILQFRQQKYRFAQEFFANAILLEPDRTEYLIGLAASSYYLGELDRAYANVQRALSLEPNSSAALHTGGIIYAAMGDFDRAESNAKWLAAVDDRRQRFVLQRVTDWRKYYARSTIANDPIIQQQLAQGLGLFGVPEGGLFDPEDSDDSDPLRRDPAAATDEETSLTTPPVPPAKLLQEDTGSSTATTETTPSTTPPVASAPSTQAPLSAETTSTLTPPPVTTAQATTVVSEAAAATGQATVAVPAKPAVPKMALIDVAIIRTDEIFRTAKGVNFLNGLNIFFTGDNIFQQETPFGIGRIRAPLTTSDTITLRLGTAGAGITYSLNIFSNAYDRNEVIARPTIVVEDQKKSSFYSGATLHIVIEGGVAGSGALQPITTGVKLEVTPKFLDADTLDMTVFAQRSFLEAGLSQVSDTITGTTFAQTTKTTISANLTLRYGETMVLSGLSDQEREVVDDKTPGLGDLPIVQYLFRRQTKTSSKKTILILLTPRRPGLTYEDGELIEDQSESGNDSNVRKLEKTADWVRPAPHLAAYVRHLGKYEFFNHYRKGDMQLENFADEGTIKDAIRRMLEYLYIYYEFEKSDKSEL